MRTLAEKYTQPTAAELLLVASGLCNGLSYLHTRRVVLCNVALRNALLAPNNVAKVRFSPVSLSFFFAAEFHPYAVESFPERSSISRRIVFQFRTRQGRVTH